LAQRRGGGLGARSRERQGGAAADGHGERCDACEQGLLGNSMAPWHVSGLLDGARTALAAQAHELV